MNVITMCVWKRPEVLRKTLHAMERVDHIGNYRLVVFCDGGGGSTGYAVREMVRKIEFAETEVHHSRTNLGCNTSTRKALARGFELSDFVIHIEEDIVMAPDSLLFMEWAKTACNLPEVWTVSLWRHPSGWLHQYGKPFPIGERIQTKAQRHGGMWIWGWATWRDRWDVMNANWTGGTDHTLSWDTCLTRLRHSLGKVAVCPLVSRAQNVGEGGIHRDGSYLDYWAGSEGFKRDTNYQLIDG